MSAVQTASAPARCAVTDGRASRNGMRKLTEMLPTVMAVACQPWRESGAAPRRAARSSR